VTRRPRAPLDRPDPLAAALDRYRAAFPEAGLPHLRGIGSAGGLGGEALEVAVGMLRRAVATHEPLDPWAIMAALGIRRPPDGPRSLTEDRTGPCPPLAGPTGPASVLDGLCAAGIS
jgi:hypothetical protein